MAARDRIQIDLRYLFNMSTDTTFIINEGESNLRDRFRTLIKDTRLFDALVAYFYEPMAESAAQTSGPREVILSEYLISPQQ